MYWLLGRKSELSTSNKPIWTYGIELWGTASTSNIEILERFQSKALRMIVDAPWYVPNTVIRRDLQYQQLKMKSAATALNILFASAQIQIVNLMELPDNRRLRKHPPNDLPTRFLA
jgi:hypothetical protein